MKVQVDEPHLLVDSFLGGGSIDTSSLKNYEEHVAHHLWDGVV